MATSDTVGPGRWEPTKGGWSWVCVAQLVPITIAVLRAVTKWVSKRLKKCKKWPWPLNWLCSFFWVVVLVVVGFVVILITVFITIYVCGWKRTEEATETGGGITSIGQAITDRVSSSFQRSEEKE